MGKTAPESKDIVFDKTIITLDRDGIGVMVAEQYERKEGPSEYKIEKYYKVDVEIDGELQEVHYWLLADPEEIEADKYYPAKEWRITQDRWDAQDFAPDWKAFSMMDSDGRGIRKSSGIGVGMPLTARHFIIWNITECTEEEDGRFFDHQPVRGSDIQLEMAGRVNLKSSVIMGGTRRRAAEV